MLTQDVVSGLEAAFPVAERNRLRDLFPGQIADRIRQAVAEFLKQFDLSNLTPEQKQAIFDGVKFFYDTVIRPLDIPYIPAFAETIVEDWIWQGVAAFLKAKLAL